LLATAGVFLTATITGLAASWIVGIPISHGLLLGSIVGSTDASAVFAIFRSGGIFVRRSLADTLEVESGSNDPMAIFMTIGMIQYLTNNVTSGLSLLWLLCNQIIVGLFIGLAVGYASVWSIRKIRLDVAGLYPILATAFGLLSYGLAADLGGSGFLSVYLTGVVIGNNRVPFLRGIEAFHDATAWLGQIVMFILLGLLSFPSRLVDVFLPGLAIAAVLTLVSRPLAIFICLIRSRFLNREKLFLSLIGLKGAVPITLAIFPLMATIDGAETIFDSVFFTVLVSAVLQGTSVKWVAQRLKLDVPPKRVPPLTLEISSLEEVQADIVDYYIDEDTCAAGKAIRDLALPEEVVVAIVVRQKQIKLPKGSFQVNTGDHVVVVLHRDVRPLVDRVFSRTIANTSGVSWSKPIDVVFPIRGDIRLRDLEEIYDVRIGNDADLSLDQWLKQQVPASKMAIGSTINCNGVSFCVQSIDDRGAVAFVGMTFLPLELKKHQLSNAVRDSQPPATVDLGTSHIVALKRDSVPPEPTDTTSKTMPEPTGSD